MLSLVDTRNRHFMQAARSIILSLPASTPIDITQVAMKAALSPAPAYYCTYEYALRMLRVLRHGRLALRRDRRLEQWQEINTKCQEVMDRRGCRLPEALAHVLSGCSASQFFISPATAVKLVQQLTLSGEKHTSRNQAAS